jgi:hypothetical protein
LMPAPTTITSNGYVPMSCGTRLLPFRCMSLYS